MARRSFWTVWPLNCSQFSLNNRHREKADYVTVHYILPPDLRRKIADIRQYIKFREDESIPIHDDLLIPARQRLKSRHPPIILLQLFEDGFDAKAVWIGEWDSKGLQSPFFEFGKDVKSELQLPRKAWCSLNRLRTGHGRCNFLMNKWGFKNDPSCQCGATQQTIEHIWSECPELRYTGELQDIKPS